MTGRGGGVGGLPEVAHGEEVAACKEVEADGLADAEYAHGGGEEL